jgi:hypothetical protein
MTRKSSIGAAIFNALPTPLPNGSSFASRASLRSRPSSGRVHSPGIAGGCRGDAKVQRWPSLSKTE